MSRWVWFVAVNILVLLMITVVLLGASLIFPALGITFYTSEDGGLNIQMLLFWCVAWGFGGSFISLAISRWLVKKLLRVQLVDPNNPGAHEKLLERTYHFCRKAGMEVMPEVGVFPSSSINALATGRSKKHALVAVSDSLLKKFDDDALDGVLAHEVAHIANGDMVTMTLVQGVINAFVMFVSRIVAHMAAEKLKIKSVLLQSFIIVVLQMVFGLIGAIAVAWFSRRREYRADRDGAGLAGKEQMIATLTALRDEYGRPNEEARPEVAAFGISPQQKKKSFSWLRSLYASHPPLDDRIAAVNALPA